MNRKIFILGLFLALSPLTAAAAPDGLEPQISAMDQLAAQQERGTATERLARKFHPFIFSQQSAELLLSGLQESRTITLMNPAAEVMETFKPVTPPMSLAHAFIALNLAKLNLAQYGISQPTPAQIKWALNGGHFTQSQLANKRSIQLVGVLKLRAQGQSWEAVAKQIGVNPNRLRYDLQAANFALINRTATPSYSSIKAFPDTPPDTPRDTSDTFVNQSAAPHIKNTQIKGRDKQGKIYGAGIVTALGGSPAIIKSINGENVAGIVTASGDFIVLGIADKKAGKTGDGL